MTRLPKGASFLNEALAIAASILFLGTVYALLAFGYSLAYSVSGAFNFAHSASFVVGGLGLATLIAKGQPLWIAIVGGIAAGAIAGIAIDRIALWPARSLPSGPLGRSRTIVAGIAALALAAALVARDANPLRLHAIPPIRLGGVLVDEHTALMASCVLILIATVTVFGASRMGLAMRAVAADAPNARAAGVDVEWTTMLSAWWGSKLAAIAGVAAVLGAHYAYALPAVFGIALCALAAAAIGGFRSLPGTIAGAYFVAAAQTAVSLASPRFGHDTGLVVLIMLAALVVLPGGVLARRALRPA